MEGSSGPIVIPGGGQEGLDINSIDLEKLDEILKEMDRKHGIEIDPSWGEVIRSERIVGTLPLGEVDNTQIRFTVQPQDIHRVDRKFWALDNPFTKAIKREYNYAGVELVDGAIEWVLNPDAPERLAHHGGYFLSEEAREWINDWLSGKKVEPREFILTDPVYANVGITHRLKKDSK